MMSERDIQETTGRLLEKWDREPVNLLQILIALQQSLHHIPDQAVDLLSSTLNISQASIEGVIGFYSFLHTSPRGEYDILFSDNIIDQMLGSRSLATQLAERLCTNPGDTRCDKQISLDYTSCTGMGDQGPAALINGYPLTSLTPERIDRITALVEMEVPVTEWPEELFHVSNNIRRRDLLLDSDLPPGRAIESALTQGAGRLLDSLGNAGLRGRGGAGFKTADKWRFCLQTDQEQRVVVCNADEGEPGTFKDRVLLQSYADRLFEGMTLCAAVVGAQKGFLYLRGEYLYLQEPLEQELEQRRSNGLLGQAILGREGFDFDITIHLGAGAYICGEESALIESLEGKRGIPRIRPPFPVTHGYLGYPTVVNNVETFIAAAMIAVYGADWFRAKGTEASTGTKLLSISGDCQRPGIYEYPFGVTLSEILHDCGAEETQAVQIAGPAGHWVAPEEFHRTIAFEDLATGGSFMIFNRSRSLLEAVNNFTNFFVHESCGFCTPCRVGTTLLKKLLNKILNTHATRKDMESIETIGTLMQETSHCGLGQTAANPILTSMKKFPLIYKSRLRTTSFEPAFDLDASLEEARLATGRDDPGAHLKRGGV
ncbi:MAG: NADH-ubiquinone oxidoreductase-F iron-sulfur binding region domain-containing protein [Sedimenticola sp.]